jgi:hypothetical protein
MQVNKVIIEYYCESSVCDTELMTITANPVIFGLDEYFITITSETGISFDGKEELIQVIDNFIKAVEVCKNN